MKKIAILLACTMMLAGCTGLLDDSTEATTYTNQDLDGVYYGVMLNLRVEMNADDSFTIFFLEMEDCYESSEEAEEYVQDSEQDASGSLIILDSCVYEELPASEEEDVEMTSILSEQSGVPYIHLNVTGINAVFVCDSGDVIDSSWVNDGVEDCAGGEDETEGAENNVTSNGVENLLNLYIAADGNGAVVYNEAIYSELGAMTCLLLSDEPHMDLMQEATVLMIAYEEEGGEIDVDDPTTLPSSVTDLFSSLDASLSNSIVGTLAPGCGDSTFADTTLTFWLWAASLAESNIDETFSFYDFDVMDAGTSLSNASNESLVYVQMNTGDDLEWATVNLQLSVNDGAYMQCTTPTETIGNNCHLTDDGDNRWSFAETITLSEGSDDLCDDSSVCELRVKIIDSMSGNTIYESNYVSVGN